MKKFLVFLLVLSAFCFPVALMSTDAIFTNPDTGILVEGEVGPVVNENRKKVSAVCVTDRTKSEVRCFNDGNEDCQIQNCP